jgi:excisionase family DNA binding protein
MNRGRPRKHETLNVTLTAQEKKLAERVLRYAQEMGTSFEKAFAQVALGRPETSEVLREVTAALHNASSDDIARVKAAVAPVPVEPDTLSLNAMARATGVPKTKIQRWLASGKIASTKDAGGVWQIHSDQVARIREMDATTRLGKTAAPAHEAPNQDLPGQNAVLWGRLVEAERVRADAAERRCDEILRLLQNAYQRM